MNHVKRIASTIDMPEGPECHLLAQKLHRWLQGRYLTKVTVLGGRYEQHGAPIGIDSLSGHTVRAVGVKGKLIYWILDSNIAILNTLGLSGTWHKSKSKHCDVQFNFERSENTGDFPTRIWFKDQLHYGTLKIVTHDALEKKLRSLGWDCLRDPADEGHGLSTERWSAVCHKHPGWTFPKLLMSQNCVSGVGNYLKSEILYDARVSPHKSIGDCNDDELDRMYRAVTNIPRRAFETKLKRGVVVRGRFFMKVYRKKTDPEGNVVKREKTADNRITHWVPACMDT
jgi:endonuclease-8